MAVPFNTLNSITEKFWIEKNMVSQVMRNTPVFLKFKEKARTAGGTEIEFPVEYARLGGGFRGKGATLTLTTPEIATKGKMGWRYVYVPVMLDQDDIDLNKSDPRKIVDYLNAYTRSALDTMREKHLGPGLWIPQASSVDGLGLDSIVDAVSDLTPYANLATADIPSWRAVIGEAIYTDTPDTPVSPSLENVKKMLRCIQAVSGKTPDLIVTSGAVYDRLSEQVTANDQISANRTNDVIRWGFTALFVDGVPVVHDLQFEEGTCEAFVGTGGSRAATKGHQMLFLNFNHLFMYHLPNRWFSWDEMGWVSPVDEMQYINKVHVTANIICTSRRAQGRFYGIDPTQDAADFTLATIPLTAFAVV